MPILEAFQANCPVICSNSSSLPEVAGDGALLCDPKDPSDIAEKMRALVFDPSLTAELIEKGKARAAIYSWENCARTLAEAIIHTTEGKALDREPKCQLSPIQSISTNFPETVAIVTPSYNQGMFLKRTIDSVLEQTYPHIDYVVVDGASADNSIEILKSYGSKLKWVSERDHGQTHAINKGFQMVNGNILAYLNSDDTLELGAVEAAVKFFKGNPNADLVYGEAKYIDEHDNVIGHYTTAPYSLERLAHDCCICQPAAFWRKRAFDKFGAFDESLRYAMDYEYWLRLAVNGANIEFLPLVLANSRLHAATKTLSARRGIYKEIFNVLLRHTGHVGQSYIQGYCQSLLWENEKILARVARNIPGYFDMLRRYYAHRLNRGRSSWHALQSATQESGKQAWKRIRRSLRFARSRVDLLDGVFGVYADNWLAPRVFISASESRNCSLVLEGHAPVDCGLRVKINKEIISEHTLYANVHLRIEIAGAVKPIYLEFDSYIVDSSKRKLAFYIKSTNCFSEHELRA